MSVSDKNILWHGTTTMPEDDTTTEIGGAAVDSKKITFEDVDATGVVKVFAENAGDTTQTITVTGRVASGEVTPEVINLNGANMVAGSVLFERLLKGVLSASAAGATAVLQNVAAYTNFAALGGGADYIDFPAAASATHDYYRGLIIHLKSGTGANQIREIVAYNGTLKRGYVYDWAGTAPNATTVFDLYRGLFFNKLPVQILQVRRIDYAAAADDFRGSDKVVHEKIACKNHHATLAFNNAKISEVAGGVAASMAFALETTLGGSDTNGSGNTRLIAPAGYTFNSDEKTVANSGALSPGAYQGIWLAYSLAAGTAPGKSTYTMKIRGEST